MLWACTLCCAAGNEDYSPFLTPWFSAFSLMLADISALQTYSPSTTPTFFSHYYTILVDAFLHNILVSVLSDLSASRLRTPRILHPA